MTNHSGFDDKIKRWIAEATASYGKGVKVDILSDSDSVILSSVRFSVNEFHIKWVHGKLPWLIRNEIIKTTPRRGRRVCWVEHERFSLWNLQTRVVPLLTSAQYLRSANVLLEWLGNSWDNYDKRRSNLQQCFMNGYVFEVCAELNKPQSSYCTVVVKLRDNRIT